jgi:hypothetical protein
MTETWDPRAHTLRPMHWRRSVSGNPLSTAEQIRDFQDGENFTFLSA